MKLSVIIPTKDRKEILDRTLNSLQEAVKGMDAEIIVINDSASPISTSSPGIRVERNTGSGAAAARNFGASIAKGELLLFIDNDVLVAKENLSRIFSLHQTYPSSAFNFYWIYPPDLKEKLPKNNFGRYMMSCMQFDNSSRLRQEDKLAAGDLIPVSGVASYFLSIEKKDLVASGGYEERIPFAGVEDIILSKKLKEKNIRMFLSKKDIVFHNEADRVSLEIAMNIYQRSAITRKAAVAIGHREMAIKIPGGKRFFYFVMLPVKGIFVFLARSIPDKKFFDPVYFRMVRLLLGISTYKGYYK